MDLLKAKEDEMDLLKPLIKLLRGINGDGFQNWAQFRNKNSFMEIERKEIKELVSVLESIQSKDEHIKELEEKLKHSIKCVNCGKIAIGLLYSVPRCEKHMTIDW